MESFGKAIFFCKNPQLLSSLDELLEVRVAETFNDIIDLDANFIFVDKTVEDLEKICYFSRHYISKEIVIFYCCSIEELSDIPATIIDDYISLPYSKNQLQYKLIYWNKKKKKPLEVKSENAYILEKIDLFINQALSLCYAQPSLAFQISSIEWLTKFLNIQNCDLTDSFIDGIFDFIKVFLSQFNSRVLIKLDFPVQSLPMYHQRNILQVLLALSRVCAIYRRSKCTVKKIDDCIYIYIDKKIDLFKDYISCILLKKIVNGFKKYWHWQTLEEGTLFKYTLFEDR
jgi:hypothetical protein